MDVMFWVWLGVIVVTAVIEFITLDMTSIWFTAGAVPSFIMAAVGGVMWEIQVVVFFCLSAILIVSLRGLTKKFLLKNANEKTNLDSYIGREFRLLERTDFESLGSVKINGVVWSAVAEEGAIEKNEIVEVVRIDGNKLVVRRAKAKSESTENEKKITEDK